MRKLRLSAFYQIVFAASLFFSGIFSGTLAADICTDAFAALTKKQKQEALVAAVVSSINSGPIQIDLTNKKLEKRLHRIAKKVHLPSLKNETYRGWIADRIANQIVFSQFNSLKILLLNKSDAHQIIIREALFDRLAKNGLTAIAAKVSASKYLDVTEVWNQIWTHPFVFPLIELLHLDISRLTKIDARSEDLAELLLNGSSSESDRVKLITDNILTQPLGVSTRRAKLRKIFGVGLLAFSIAPFLLDPQSEFEQIQVEGSQTIVSETENLSKKVLELYNSQLEVEFNNTIDLLKERGGTTPTLAEKTFIKQTICSNAQTDLQSLEGVDAGSLPFCGR